MLIENPKTYKGTDLETIFFRPTFCGKSAEDFGIRVIYTMPVPTTVQVWSQPEQILRSYENGWSGGSNAQKFQKTINMNRVKAETRFSADDYFSMVFEKIASNGQDLTGTELEKAETELFRQAIAEGVRSTMWLGDTNGTISELTTFDGIFANIKKSLDCINHYRIDSNTSTPDAVDMFRSCWDEAGASLKALRSEGNLAYFVSSDVYNNYLDYLDSIAVDSAYTALVNGHADLCYRGIPVIEVPLGKYEQNEFSTFCMLTDRRNLVLALNTADMPENEVRMWYNPDEMENRQRAVFLAGADFIDQDLISIYYSAF